MKSFVLCALGANAEIEALKKAVAEADKKAAVEKALREKHEARVIEAERELQEAVKKSEGLEQSLVGKESELAQALQAAEDAREEARGAVRDIQEARKVAAGKAFCILSPLYMIMGRILSGKLNSYFSRGFCGSSSQHIRCRPILPHRGEEVCGEGFLVAVFGAELSGAFYRSAEAAGRTAPGGRTSHEGLGCPAVARGANSKQLLWTREADCGHLSSA